ncbi:MAG: HNH endonuclease [Elusimicrobia bacterium]|nr:HNH endonuclease [Elusimicrobiota bacterium]
MQTLVLNSNFQPVTIVSWQKAVVLWYKNKAEVIDSYNKDIRSVNSSIKAPSIIRLLNLYSRKKKLIKFSRSIIYRRDRGRCGYCNKRISLSASTLDHLIPVSKGGATNWSNVVNCCYSCNNSKGNKTPEEAGMSLQVKPCKPSSLPPEILLKKIDMPSSWAAFMTSEEFEC